MKSTSTVLQQLSEAKQIVIFGTGYIAEQFTRVLIEQGLEGRIAGYITSDGNVGEYMGFPVNRIQPSQVELDTLICIAVHECHWNKVETYLQQIGVDRTLWITPHLYTLLLGKPLEKSVSVPIDEIMRANAFSYKPAVITLAIKSYFGLCNQGKEWYIYLQAHYSSRDTGEIRYRHLCELIQSVERDGYQGSHSSLLLENYSIVDGAHRICVAAYFGYEDVVCDIYPQTKNIGEIDSGEALMTRESLLLTGLSTGARNAIEAQHKKLLQGLYNKE